MKDFRRGTYGRDPSRQERFDVPEDEDLTQAQDYGRYEDPYYEDEEEEDYFDEEDSSVGSALRSPRVIGAVIAVILLLLIGLVVFDFPRGEQAAATATVLPQAQPTTTVSGTPGAAAAAQPSATQVPGAAAAEPTATNAPAAGTGQTYEVKAGDTLSTIAQQVYGDPGKWQQIFDANQDVLKDPNRLQPGMTLKIPAQ